MRKFCAVFFALLLCVLVLIGCQAESVSGSSNEPTFKNTIATTEAKAPTMEALVTQSQMDDIQEDLHREQALCAVAYVGYCSGNFEEIQEGFDADGITEVLPIVAEVKEENLISNAGSELYLVVPRDEVGLSVYEQVMDENTGKLTHGEPLYRQSETEPILLRGNISDIFPNLAILIEAQGGETLEYCPSLRLQDGRLAVDSTLICDMTPYKVLGISVEPESDTEDPKISSWFAEAPNTAGDMMLLELVLNYDGYASYGYGAAEAEFYEFFEGQWYEEHGELILQLNGGPLYDAEEHYDFYGKFQWEYDEGQLTLTHIDGNTLIYGLEGGSICFKTSNQYALIGLWTTNEYDYENDLYIYYDLELLGDETCSLLIHSGEGVTYAAYGGFWSVINGELSVQMGMYSGNDYQEGIEQSLAGIYHAEIDADGWLILIFIDGDNLTPYMTDCGLELFEPTVSYG